MSDDSSFGSWPIKFHPLLVRQMQKSGLAVDSLPLSLEAWHAFLNRVNRTYVEADQDRYTLERSLNIVSTEMQQLYESLRQSSETALAIERDKLKATQQHLLEAKETAERASRAKSDFLANMSHELRTPLNAVMGFTRVLAGGAHGSLTSQQLRFVSNVSRSAEHMLSLINDLLDLRRVEENRAPLDLVLLSVESVWDEAIQLLGVLLAERKQSIATWMDDEARELRTDRRALLQIIVNLLSNASKFSPTGSTISIHAHRTLEARIVMEIHDSGQGISKEDQERLFVYFSQVGEKQAHKFKGSGVGLALTKSLVEQLGGSILVDSSLGYGSTFTIVLPSNREETRDPQ